MSRLGAATLAILVCAAFPATADELPSLAEVMERMRRVAGLYRDAALDFTCDEKIRYTAIDESEQLRFRYIYRYSDESGKLEDYRVPWGGDRKQPPPADHNYGLPVFFARAYAWVFLFNDEHSALHRFAVEEADEALGRPAIRLAFEALPPFLSGRNEWIGTMWIDRESFQLLRVEAHLALEMPQVQRLERARAEGLEADKAKRTTLTFSHVTTEFDVVRNGMRFPGRVTVTRTDYRLTARKRGGAAVNPQELYRIVQTYSGYRFFKVRTAEQIRGIVDGG